MKRTLEDQQFGEDFAEKLRPFYDRALAKGETEKSFARRIGVDRGGLQRYLRDKATPSVRTLVFAYREFRIVIPYAQIDTKALVRRRTPLRESSAQFQLDLPFSIGPVDADLDVIEMKKKPQSYEIKFQLRKRS